MFDGWMLGSTHISVGWQMGPRYLEDVLAHQYQGYRPEDQESVPEAPKQEAATPLYDIYQIRPYNVHQNEHN